MNGLVRRSEGTLAPLGGASLLARSAALLRWALIVCGCLMVSLSAWTSVSDWREAPLISPDPPQEQISPPGGILPLLVAWLPPLPPPTVSQEPLRIQCDPLLDEGCITDPDDQLGGGAPPPGQALCRLGQGEAYACLFCDLFADLDARASRYARATYGAVAIAALELLRAAALFMILAMAIQLFLNPRRGGEILRDLGQRILLVMLAGAALSALDEPLPWDPGERAPFVFGYLFDFMQEAAMEFARGVIAIAQDISDLALPGLEGGNVTRYAALWQGVEAIPYGIVVISFEEALNVSLLAFVNSLAWLLLAAPYVFVLGIFAAYLVQTMFYFLGISVTFPLLLAGIVFRPTRGLVVGALRLLLSGMLTIVFAAAAMGFTAMVLLDNLKDLQKALGCSGSAEVTLLVTSAPYWSAFIIGFLSVLLHLTAPRIAANLSGASDSPGTAAAVVAVGQLAAARVIGAGRQGLIGNPAQSGELGGGAGYALNRGKGLYDRITNAFKSRRDDSDGF